MGDVGPSAVPLSAPSVPIGATGAAPVTPPPSPSMSSSSDLIGGLQEKIASEDKLKSDISTRGAKLEDSLGKLKDMVAAPPTPQQTSPVQAFGSAATFLATMGSLLTRRHMTNALNASADVMDAFKKNDAAATQQAFTTWKTQVDQAIHIQQFENDAYRAAIDGDKEAIAVTAAALKDHTILHLVETGQREAAIDILTGRVRNTATMGAQAMKLEDMRNRKAMVDKAMSLMQQANAAQAAGDAPKAAELKAQAAQMKDQLAAYDKLMEPGAQESGKEDAETGLLRHKLDAVDAVSKASAELAAARKSGDPEKITAAQTAMNDAMEVVTKLGYAGHGATTSAAGAANNRAEALAVDEFRKNNDRDPGPDDKAELARLTDKYVVEGKGVITDEAAHFAAQRVWAGDEKALTGMARSSANITKVNNEIVAEGKRLGKSAEELAAKVAEFGGVVAGQRTLGTRAANMGVAANEVRVMAPVALDASSKVDRSRYSDLNAIIQSAERRTGDPNIIRFGLAANSLIYTYSKFLNPTGIPTDADKARATEILATAWSKGQFEAAIDQIVNKEIPSGLAAVRATRGELNDSLTGKGVGPGTGRPSGATREDAVPISNEAETNTLPDGTWIRLNGRLGQVHHAN